jgi:hypothetical protein
MFFLQLLNYKKNNNINMKIRFEIISRNLYEL